jgi:glycosyltransferase involved in cell wall biosynthesis
LRERGYRIVILAPRDPYAEKLVQEGAQFWDIPMEAKGKNPLRELGLLFRYWDAYRKIRPLAALHYTIKPDLYGSIAARFLHIPVINNVTGLGTVFEKGGPLEILVRILYRFAFAKAQRIFFQNQDDYRLFIDHGLVRKAQTDILPGSGVDIQRFVPEEFPPIKTDEPFIFLFVGRLLKAKGVEDLIAAAPLVREKHPNATIVLLGKRDDRDPTSADPKLLDRGIGEKLVEYGGIVDDVKPWLTKAHCVVLPSYYREGIPRSLLEAAAMGKPLIAADSVGTREPVINGENGFLCESRNPKDLAEKMIAMIELPPEKLREMGAASRRLAENRFDERIVLDKYIQNLEVLAPLPPPTD